MSGLRMTDDLATARLDGLGTGLRMTDSLATARLDGFGDWKSEVSMLIAEGELNKLLSAVFQLNDQLRGLVEARNPIYDGYLVAKKLYDEAVARAGGSAMMALPGGIFVPDPVVLPSMQALATARIAVEQFARQISTIIQLSKVFNSVSKTLTAQGMENDANSIDQVLAQIQRFVYDTDNKFSGVPEYAGMKSKIMSAALSEWKAWGISSDDTSNSWWFQAFIKAAQKVCPAEGDQWPIAGLSGTGLGVLPTIALVIIAIVKIVAAVTAIIISLKIMLSALNSKAETAKVLILDRNKQKEDLRLKLVGMGKSQADINAAMAAFDVETKQQVTDIPDSSLGGTLTMIAALAAAAFIVPALIGGRS